VSKKLISMFLILTMMIVLVIGCSSQSNNDVPADNPAVLQDISLNAVAGGVGGAWFSTFASLSEYISTKEPAIQMNLSPGSGIGNSATIGNGQFDIGWIFPTMALASYEGVTPYDTPTEDLRMIAGGFSPNFLEISVLADSNITSLEDVFKNKQPVSFLTGRKGSTTPALFFDMMLAYYGLTSEDIESWGGKVYYAAYSDWPQLAQDGHIDIMFNQIAMPSSILQEIMTHREVKLLPYPKDLQDHMAEKYALEKMAIPAGSYNFLTEDVECLRLTSGLGANKNTPDEVVYRILEIIDENIEEVKAIHPSWAEFDIKTAWKNSGVPLHAGAEKFYKDKGYMQ